MAEYLPPNSAMPVRMCLFRNKRTGEEFFSIDKGDSETMNLYKFYKDDPSGEVFKLFEFRDQLDPQQWKHYVVGYAGRADDLIDNVYEVVQRGQVTYSSTDGMSLASSLFVRDYTKGGSLSEWDDGFAKPKPVGEDEEEL